MKWNSVLSAPHIATTTKDRKTFYLNSVYISNFETRLFFILLACHHYQPSPYPQVYRWNKCTIWSNLNIVYDFMYIHVGIVEFAGVALFSHTHTRCLLVWILLFDVGVHLYQPLLSCWRKRYRACVRFRYYWSLDTRWLGYIITYGECTSSVLTI